MKEVIVSPSVLGADFLNFEKEVVKMQAAGLPNERLRVGELCSGIEPDVKALLLTYLYCFISFQFHYQILIRCFFGMNSLPFLMLKASYHSSI